MEWMSEQAQNLSAILNPLKHMEGLINDNWFLSQGGQNKFEHDPRPPEKHLKPSLKSKSSESGE